MRTFLEQHGYNTEVIDHLDKWNVWEILELIELFYTDDMLFIGFSLSFYRYLRQDILPKIKLRWPHLKIIFGGQEIVLGLIKDEVFADKAFYGYSETAFLHYLDFLTGKRPDDLEWQLHEGSGVEYVIADKQYPYTNTGDLSIQWKHSHKQTNSSD